MTSPQVSLNESLFSVSRNAGFSVWVVRTSRVDSMLFDPWVSSVWSTCASRAQAPYEE